MYQVNDMIHQEQLPHVRISFSFVRIPVRTIEQLIWKDSHCHCLASKMKMMVEYLFEDLDDPIDQCHSLRCLLCQNCCSFVAVHLFLLFFFRFRLGCKIQVVLVDCCCCCYCGDSELYGCYCCCRCLKYLIDCEQEQQEENEREANLTVCFDDGVVGAGVGAGVGGIVDSTLDDWNDPGVALATVAERRVSCPLELVGGTREISIAWKWGVSPGANG